MRSTNDLHKVISFGRKVRLHRAVVEGLLGCPLPSTLVVHHRDGDPSNNRPENLSIMGSRPHMQLHHPRKVRICKWCGGGYHRVKNGRADTPTYCSPVCQVASMVKQRYCKYCNESLPLRSLKESKARTCGRCGPTVSTPRLCVGCGIVFFRQSKGKGKPPRFCTGGCFHSWQKRSVRRRKIRRQTRA